MITHSVFRSCAAAKTPGVKKKGYVREWSLASYILQIMQKYQPLLLALAKSCRKVSEKKALSKI